MKYVGYYAGDLCIKVIHTVGESSLPIEDVKKNWESSFNSELENLIKEVLSDDCEHNTDVEVVLTQDYVILDIEGDDHAGEKLQH